MLYLSQIFTISGDNYLIVCAITALTVKLGAVWRPNWPKCDILHICIMRKLVENCVHSLVKKALNFMNLKGLLLQGGTLLAAPRGERGKVGQRQEARWR